MRARTACGSGDRTLAGLTWKTHLRFIEGTEVQPVVHRRRPRKRRATPKSRPNPQVLRRNRDAGWLIHDPPAVHRCSIPMYDEGGGADG
jgi:hypothetical protein